MVITVQLLIYYFSLSLSTSQSFFGRSFNNVAAISECKNNGECVINKKNRTTCKACRLRKCLMVGMSKSGSRYGRRSNWFKIHCLLQEQQEAQEKHQQQLQDGRNLSPSPYSFGMPPNHRFLHKSSHDEDFKTVSTPSTSPASSHISDTPSHGLDLLSKMRANNAPPMHMFEQNQTTTSPQSKIPKDFFMPMAFPGMPFPLPTAHLAQLFFSGFGAAAAAASHPGAGSGGFPHHYQDMLKSQTHLFGNPELLAKPMLSMDQMIMQRQIEEERQRILNSPPVSVSPASPPRPLSCEGKAPSSSQMTRLIQVTAEEEEEEAEEEEEDNKEKENHNDINEEPATKRQKRNPVCGNTEESSNNRKTTLAVAAGDEPLDLSLTKGSSNSSSTEHEATHLLLSSKTMSSASSNNRQKYKGTDCPAVQTGEAEADDADEDADVQVDVDDEKQTAFFDYFKQTFVRENQFLKIKNNEIYSF